MLTQESSACPICLDNLSHFICQRSACQHVFHIKCLAQWHSQELSCPLCRTPLGLIPYERLCDYTKDYLNFWYMLDKTGVLPPHLRTNFLENNFFHPPLSECLSKKLRIFIHTGVSRELEADTCEHTNHDGSNRCSRMFYDMIADKRRLGSSAIDQLQLSCFKQLTALTQHFFTLERYGKISDTASEANIQIKTILQLVEELHKSLRNRDYSQLIDSSSLSQEGAMFQTMQKKFRQTIIDTLASILQISKKECRMRLSRADLSLYPQIESALTPSRSPFVFRGPLDLINVIYASNIARPGNIDAFHACLVSRLNQTNYRVYIGVVLLISVIISYQTMPLIFDGLPHKDLNMPVYILVSVIYSLVTAFITSMSDPIPNVCFHQPMIAQEAYLRTLPDIVGQDATRLLNQTFFRREMLSIFIGLMIGSWLRFFSTFLTTNPV